MTVLKVSNMRCEGCVKTIQNALRERGIQAEISLKDKTASIADDDKVEEAKVAIRAAGYSLQG